MLAAGDARARRAGFTLIELLAVLIILSILIALLVTNLRGGQEAVEVGVARQRIAQLSALLNELSDDTGGFPPSQIAADLGAADATNVGAECLYLALCAQGAPGFGVLDGADDLCNTDGDALARRPAGFETQQLFELSDPWGNPYAYIQAADYEREFQYVCVDADGVEEQFTVRARKNEKTSRYEEPRTFQIFSAGPDGRFGTEDDLANFKTKQ